MNLKCLRYTSKVNAQNFTSQKIYNDLCAHIEQISIKDCVEQAFTKDYYNASVNSIK